MSLKLPDKRGFMNPWLHLLITFAFGPLGLHRFLNGQVATGLLMLFSLGGIGIWYLIDLFASAKRLIQEKAAKRRFSLHQ